MQVFINSNGQMSLTQKKDSVKVGDIHRYQGCGSFQIAIEEANFNEMKAQSLTRDFAYKTTQSPYTSNTATIIYIDNIKDIKP